MPSPQRSCKHRWWRWGCILKMYSYQYRKSFGEDVIMEHSWDFLHLSGNRISLCRIGPDVTLISGKGRQVCAWHTVFGEGSTQCAAVGYPTQHKIWFYSPVFIQAPHHYKATLELMNIKAGACSMQGTLSGLMRSHGTVHINIMPMQDQKLQR